MAKGVLDYPVLSTPALEDIIAILDMSESAGSRSKRSTLEALRQLFGSEPIPVAQTAHGLSVGDLLRHNGTSFVEATADTESNAVVIGIVTAVGGVDSFEFRTTGYIEGLSGLTGGSVHYLQDAGGLGTAAGTVEKPVLLALSSSTGVLLAVGAGSGGGSATVAYDLVLGFVGNPSANDLDWLLVGRSVTVSSADPGEAHARTNPAATWTADILKNGASVGSVEISTAGADTFTVASDISLAAGDRIEVQAPASADGSINDIQVTLKATVD